MLFDPQVDPSFAYASVGASVAQSGVRTGAPGPFAHLAPLSPSGATNGAPAPASPSVLSAIYTLAKLQSMEPSRTRVIARVLIRGYWDAGIAPPAWLMTISHL